MSVDNTEQVSYKPWSGFAEDGLPAGVWYGYAEILGDASGGSRTCQIQFKAAAANLVNVLYSLEQVQVFDTDQAGKFVDLLLNGWDIHFGRADVVLGNTAYTFALAASPIAGAGFNTRDNLPLPIILGIPGRVIASTVLGLRAVNVDADTLRFYVQGYFWTPRSFQSPGGPQRPQTSLY